jgi:excisionase family DNA binding protein
MEPSPSERYYRIREVAAILSLHPQSIWNAIKRGDIASFRLGREHRIAASEVARLLFRPSHTPTPTA